MRVMLQHDERDCGAACLAMISTYYGRHMSVARCRELTKTDREGTNIYGLVDGAAKIGLRANALKGDPEGLMESLRAHGVSFPFIAHVVSNSGMLHYVVAYGIGEDCFKVADPELGKVVLSLKDFFAQWTGHIITFETTPAFQKGREKAGGLMSFLWLLKGQYGKLAASFAASLLIASIGIAGSLVFKIVIDAADQAAAYLNSIFVGLIGLYLLQALVQYLRGRLISDVSRKVDVDLTLKYYNHVIDLPFSSLAARKTGDYLSRFSDASKIQSAISTAAITVVLDAVMTVGCGVILFQENRVMFGVSLIVIAAYAVIVLAFRKPLGRSNLDVMENNAVLESYFTETINGSQTIRAAGAGEEVKDKTGSQYRRFADAVFHNGMLTLSQSTLADAAELIGTAIILWIGFSFVLQGQFGLGDLITFNALLVYFMSPVKNLITFQPTLQAAKTAADRLNDILELETEKTEEGHELPAVREWALDHVSFRYGNRQEVLHDISLTIHRGEKIAIVGESGSGKTTLANLLLRFYDPESGDILLDNESVRDFDVKSLRQNIAYVNQTTFLFSDTIRNNLKLGNPGISDDEIMEACRISHADTFINSLPMGLDTPLEEKGANLSGGQRQRLSIARALLKKPQLLILDEATSNLDTVTETGIRNTIFSTDRELTCLIIAHRLSTIRDCDRIFVMDHGRIVEEGTHSELLERGGYYKKLWDMQ